MISQLCGYTTGCPDFGVQVEKLYGLQLFATLLENPTKPLQSLGPPEAAAISDSCKKLIFMPVPLFTKTYIYIYQKVCGYIYICVCVHICEI